MKYIAGGSKRLSPALIYSREIRAVAIKSTYYRTYYRTYRTYYRTSTYRIAKFYLHDLSTVFSLSATSKHSFIPCR